MRRIGDADGKGTSGLDVLNGFMGFGQVEHNGIPFLHRSPRSVHDIDGTVLVISCDHQDRHREDTFRNIELFSHRE